MKTNDLHFLKYTGQMLLSDSPSQAVVLQLHAHCSCIWNPSAVALLLFCIISNFAWAQAEPPPLIENIRELHCAADESAARQALYRLKNNFDSASGLPDEWEGKKETRKLHAGTLDLAIETTVRQIQNFPALTTLGESILLQWNYCEVYHNGIAYDLSYQKSNLNPKKSRAKYLPPGNWDGLSMLGLGNSGVARYFPKAFSNTATTYRGQLLYNWWNLQRNQCLPHPDTGQMFHRKQYVARARVDTASPTGLDQFPVRWSGNCSVSFTRNEHKHLADKIAQTRKKTQFRDKTPTLPLDTPVKPLVIPVKLFNTVAPEATVVTLASQTKESEPVDSVPEDSVSDKPDIHTGQAAPLAGAVSSHTKKVNGVEVDRAPTNDTLLTESSTSPYHSTDDTDSRNAALTNLQRTADDGEIATSHYQSMHKLSKEEAARNEKQLAQRVDTYREQLRNQDKNDTQSVIDQLQLEQLQVATASVKPDTPELAAAYSSTREKNPTNPISYQSSSVPPFESPHAKESTNKARLYHGLTGSIALSNRSFETDAWSLTTNFSYKPIIASYFFARAGFTFTENEKPVSYYWGVGYNDWHTDTWAFELNNWGPLHPGDGLEVEKSIASVSYKFESKLLAEHNFSSSLTLSASKNNSPSLTLAGTWAPKPNWFIRNIITQPLEGGNMTWAYGFGYNNYRENTFSLEYNNWGPNTLSAPGFTKNALVTLSWKWNL